MDTHPALTGQTWIPEADTFGARLALLRHRMGWNITEAARACGVSESAWRDWELRNQLPRNLQLVTMKIHVATGCSAPWLQGYTVHRPGRAPRKIAPLRARQDSNLEPSDPKVDASGPSATHPRNVPHPAALTRNAARNTRQEFPMGGAA